MIRIVLLSIIIMYSFMQTGCADIVRGAFKHADERFYTEESWIYKPNTYKQTIPVFEKSAVVIPFIGEGKPSSPLSLKDAIISIIPGVLFVSGEYLPWFDPEVEFAKALALDLQGATIFSEVRYDNAAGNADFIVSGKVLDTTMTESVYMYGASIMAPFLWIVLPRGAVYVNLSVEITCKDAKTGNIVISKAYTSHKYSNFIWVYNKQKDRSTYGEMIQDIYKQFVEELRVKLAETRHEVVEVIKELHVRQN